MGRWPGKFVIGLTGNIATGKSVVRKMLEHLGAHGIDADALAHRAIAKGAPGYSLVVNSFGAWILDNEGQISRSRLAKVVFADPGAMKLLESIVHPLVSHAIDLLVQRTSLTVVVIEAIKLLETDLAAGCDQIWVVDVPEEVQISRLLHKRDMTEEIARVRIAAQGPQADKVKAADVVISNDGSFDHTWEQVQAAWAKLPAPREPLLVSPAAPPPGGYFIRRGRPQDAAVIANFITRITRGKRRMTRQNVMAAFGEKAYLMIEQGEMTVGVIGWQVENLVTRIDELHFAPSLDLVEAIPALMSAIEAASVELQSEASLLFLPPYLAQRTHIWRETGYRPQTVQGLGVRAWQEAAIVSMPRGASLWFKRLREDRVLRPL